MTTTRFRVGCSIEYWLGGPTALVFGIEAAHLPRQTVVDEALTFTPPCAPERYTEPTGNRHVRVHANRGVLRVDYTATIDLTPRITDPALVQEVPPERLPLDVLAHLYPSRYCQSDRLELFAQRTFGHLAPGHLRVTAICNWICQHVDYASGSSTPLTSATDTLLERHGVCRDFTHLGVSLCRALGIPARYVSVYAWRLHPSDFHAVFEAWLDGPSGGAWWLFDPTRRGAVDGLIRNGVGRDAGEVAFGTLFGPAEGEPPHVWVEGPAEADTLTVQAVSVEA